jgi:hypothetical protein
MKDPTIRAAGNYEVVTTIGAIPAVSTRSGRQMDERAFAQPTKPERVKRRDKK